MGIYIFLYIFLSYAIMFIVFWFLFYFVGFLLKKKYSKDEKLIYECGYKNFNTINIGINISFFWSACLVILYELELLFVLPVLINSYAATPSNFAFVVIFVCLLNLTLYVDIKLQITKWVY